MSQILNEEITPTLTKLKEERSTYLEYQKIQRELEHLTKLYIAYKFVTAEEASQKTKDGLEVINKEMASLKTNIKGMKIKLRTLTGLWLHVDSCFLQRARRRSLPSRPESTSCRDRGTKSSAAS